MQMKPTPDFIEGWTSHTNRRRYAAVLVAAWAVFWVALLGQPCSEALAATPEPAKSRITLDVYRLAGHAHPDTPDAQRSVYCPELTALDSGSVNSAAAKPDRQFVAFPPWRDSAFFSTGKADTRHRGHYGRAPPPIALYLRNLHLLI
jgi:hypothetical protein